MLRKNLTGNILILDKAEIEERSARYFQSGFWCAESVLQSLAAGIGEESKVLPRIASGFCSGIARSGALCGALSGAIMGLGMAYGRSTPQDDLQYLFELVQALLDRFRNVHQAVDCRELLGCDLNTPEGQRYYKEMNLKAKCLEFTRDATRLAVQLIEEGI